MDWDRARKRDLVRDAEPLADQPSPPAIRTTPRQAAFFARRQARMRAAVLSGRDRSDGERERGREA